MLIFWKLSKTTAVLSHWSLSSSKVDSITAKISWLCTVLYSVSYTGWKVGRLYCSLYGIADPDRGLYGADLRLGKFRIQDSDPDIANKSQMCVHMHICS
jgi:hypothetical protein